MNKSIAKAIQTNQAKLNQELLSVMIGAVNRESSTFERVDSIITTLSEYVFDVEEIGEKEGGGHSILFPNKWGLC